MLASGKSKRPQLNLHSAWIADTILKALLEMLTSKSKSNRGGLKLPSAWMPLSVVCDSPNNHLPPIHWNEFNATTSTHRHTVVKFWLEKVVKSLDVLTGIPPTVPPCIGNILTAKNKLFLALWNPFYFYCTFSIQPCT